MNKVSVILFHSLDTSSRLVGVFTSFQAAKKYMEDVELQQFYIRQKEDDEDCHYPMTFNEQDRSWYGYMCQYDIVEQDVIA